MTRRLKLKKISNLVYACMVLPSIMHATTAQAEWGLGMQRKYERDKKHCIGHANDVMRQIGLEPPDEIAYGPEENKRYKQLFVMCMADNGWQLERPVVRR